MADAAMFADLVGVPFAYGGRGPHAYDCYGLVMECWRRVHGQELPDLRSPTVQAEQMALGTLLAGTVNSPWQPTERGPGVVAAVRIGHYVSHCGFLIDENTLIHAWERTGGATICEVSADWLRRIEGYYRYVG